MTPASQEFVFQLFNLLGERVGFVQWHLWALQAQLLGFAGAAVLLYRRNGNNRKGH